MNGFRIQEPGVLGLITTTLPRDEMIQAIQALYQDGSDAVRIGITEVQGELFVVSGNLKGDECFDSATGLLSFRELLDVFPTESFNCLVPHRGPNWIPLYADIVRGNNAQVRVLTSVLYGKNIVKLSRIMKDGVFSYSFTGLIGIYALFRSGLIYFKKKYRFQWLQTYEKIGPSYIASQGLVRQLRACGVRVQVFTADDEKTIRRLYDAGVRYFISENPRRVREALAAISS